MIKHHKESGLKGRTWLALVLLFTITCSATTAFGGADQNQVSKRKKIGISLKLSGSGGYLLNGMGDLNSFRLSRKAEAEGLDQESGYSSVLNWGSPWFVPDLSADIIVNVGGRFGFGFGTGFIQGQSKGVHSVKYSEEGYDWWSGDPYKETSKWVENDSLKLTAVPIKFDLYFFQPLKSSGKISLFAHAGVGYYSGKLRKSYDQQGESKTDYFGSVYLDEWDNSITENAKNHAWGYHGGFGLEFKIAKGISFCSEVFGRYVDFNDWRGDANYSHRSNSKAGDDYGWWYENSEEETAHWKGSMWTYQIYDGNYDITHTYVFTFPDKPQGTDFKNVRKSALNLNAFGIVLSVKFHFDLF